MTDPTNPPAETIWDKLEFKTCHIELMEEEVDQAVARGRILEKENARLKEPLRFSIDVPGDYQIKYKYEEHDGKQILMKVLERMR